MGERTQRAKILSLLISANGGEVPLPAIRACAAQYASRILELRRAGFRIPPPRMAIVNGQRYTWYRLEIGPAPVPQPQSADVQELSLFPLEARHRDDA